MMKIRNKYTREKRQKSQFNLLWEKSPQTHRGIKCFQICSAARDENNIHLRTGPSRKLINWRASHLRGRKRQAFGFDLFVVSVLFSVIRKAPALLELISHYFWAVPILFACECSERLFLLLHIGLATTGFGHPPQSNYHYKHPPPRHHHDTKRDRLGCQFTTQIRMFVRMIVCDECVTEASGANRPPNLWKPSRTVDVTSPFSTCLLDLAVRTVRSMARPLYED